MSSSHCELGISSFPGSVRFKDTWRDYQARVLDRLNEYLSDDRIHIIAAPGSGKTVLGLEIIRRVNRPTLVLAPTLTIRDQWVSRFLAHFTDFGYDRPDWISTELHNPRFLTLTTYQALHAACTQGSEQLEIGEGFPDSTSESEVLQRASSPKIPQHIKEIGFRTLVVDEAHHLRTEWWKSIQLLVSELQKPTIVALTATPPFDVTPYEWERYQELCGPVDAQVSVPELVLKGDLCPHQDYVVFTSPSVKEETAICGFHERVNGFVAGIRTNRAFAEAVCGHPWIQNAEANIEKILENPELLSSMLIYLNASGLNIPKSALNLLAVNTKILPELTLEWLEILLTHLLYRNPENLPLEVTKSLRRDLQSIGAVERQRVTLRDSSDFMKLLTTSASKLPAIGEIAQLETDSLGADLRMVVLTDFIRKLELPHSREEDQQDSAHDIGVVPIFEELRKRKLHDVRLCILSGSLVVVPALAHEALCAIARELQIDEEQIGLRPLAHDREYLEMSLPGSNSRLVSLVTEMFARGHVNVLVGTKSLLGEGWDAPCINALVLASFVGSYMLSNQMRGRAIRVDKCQPQKTANIWHIVCVEPGPFGPGADLDLLARRLGSFSGVHFEKPVIESGVGRLELGRPPFSRDDLLRTNARMMSRARDRKGMRRQWEAALGSGQLLTMAEGMKAPEATLPRGFVFANTIVALLVEGTLVAYLVWELMLSGLRGARFKHPSDLFSYLALVALLAAVLSAPFFLKAAWRWLRHGSIESSMKQVGRAIVEGLWKARLIDTDPAKFRVYADRNRDGSIYCWIGGGDLAEQHLFLSSLKILLDPIENPRYLLSRKPVWRFFREDYFAVPDEIAKKKEWAEMFAKSWSRLVGPMILVYTRNEPGRRLLVRARFRSLSARYQSKAERLSCWK